ncbi:MAG: hypothetical protein KIT34_14235 [Cyanobacteria bacterium TGS_CYA1]|nr:hypothetical protein [Cyanobacteria bacterium TGS_CYA1]
MNNNKCRVVSLIFTALFICLVSLANRAYAGSNTLTDAQRQILINSSSTPAPSSNTSTTPSTPPPTPPSPRG